MKRIIITLLLCTPVVMSGSPLQGTDCSSCTIYSSYIRGDMQMWYRVMDQLKAEYNRVPSACSLYILTEARYGYIGYLLSRGDKDAARPLIDEFEKEIELLSEYPEYRTETEAFRVSLLGFRIGLNPARAVTLGPKALKQLQTAMEAGGYNPSVWIEKANSEASMPAFAGGSEKKAAASFTEALRLFEADGGPAGCNWRYLNTMVLLGQLLEKMEDYKGAREVYKRALVREPGFVWVRDELLPAVEKQLK